MILLCAHRRSGRAAPRRPHAVPRRPEGDAGHLDPPGAQPRRRAPFQRSRVHGCVPVRRDTCSAEVGDGWQQVTSELAFERTGPERFLSAFTLLVELMRALGPAVGARPHRARAHRRAHPHAAAPVALGRRHAAGGREPGPAGGAGQGSRHHAGAGDASRSCAS